VVINILLLAVFVYGLSVHLIQPIYTNDNSYLSFVMSALMLTNVGLSIFYSWKTVKPQWIEDYVYFVSGKFLFIGIAGTLVGLSILFNSLHLENASSDQVNQTIGLLINGMKTMVNCTLIGVICKLWSDLLLTLNEQVNQ